MYSQGCIADGAGRHSRDCMKELSALRSLMEKKYGLVYDGPDAGLLDQAVVDRMRALGISDLRSYFSLVSGGSGGEAELRLLVDVATVRETRFLRSRGLFAVLKDEIIPDLLSRPRPAGAEERGLRAWSAGCSSGDEAYSLAMVLLECLRDRCPLPVKVVGTDISISALSHAARGLYSANSLRNVDERLLARYFTEVRSDSGQASDGERRSRGASSRAWRESCQVRYKVRRELSTIVEFMEHNLTQTPYPQYLHEFDLILCRNVLMYFSEETASRIVEELGNCLSEGGYLVLDPWVSPVRVAESKFCQIQCAYGVVIQKLSNWRRRPSPEGRLARIPLSTPLVSPACTMRASAGGTRQVSVAKSLLEPSSSLAGRPVPASSAGSGKTPGLDQASVQEKIEHARALADRGDFVDALSLLHDAKQVAPLDPRVHLLMGEIYLQLSDAKASSRCFGNLIYLEPENVVAHWRMADVYRLMGRHNDELRQLYNVLQCLEDSESGEQCELPGEVLMKACLNRIEKLRASQRDRAGNACRP